MNRTVATIPTKSSTRLRIVDSGKWIHVYREYVWRSDPSGWRCEPDSGLTIKRTQLADLIRALQAAQEPGVAQEKKP